eukprot:6213544-Pleurochrysis_carterae.AAC.1
MELPGLLKSGKPTRQLIFTDSFWFSNWRSIRAAKALCRPARPSGASTRRPPGFRLRLSDRSLEPAVRVQKGSFCTTHYASSWCCALAARCSRGEKHPGLAHTSVWLELKVLSEDRPAVPETRRRRAPTEQPRHKHSKNDRLIVG